VGVNDFGLIPTPLGLLSGRRFPSSLESDDCGSGCGGGGGGGESGNGGGGGAIFFFPDAAAIAVGHPTGVF
jgi:hypothetical protein